VVFRLTEVEDDDTSIHVLILRRNNKPYIGVLKCDRLPDPLSDYIAGTILDFIARKKRHKKRKGLGGERKKWMWKNGLERM